MDAKSVDLFPAYPDMGNEWKAVVWDRWGQYVETVSLGLSTSEPLDVAIAQATALFPDAMVRTP